MNTGSNHKSVAEVSSTEATIADLQSRVAFQEDTLQALNQIIADQDAGIRQLQKQVQLLNKKLNDVASNLEQSGNSNDEEAPPHY